MVLKWNPMSKNLQIYIGLLILLVIFHSKPASTKRFGESLRYSIPEYFVNGRPDGRLSTSYISTSGLWFASRPQSGSRVSTSYFSGTGLSGGSRLSGGSGLFEVPRVTLSQSGSRVSPSFFSGTGLSGGSRLFEVPRVTLSQSGSRVSPSVFSGNGLFGGTGLLGRSFRLTLPQLGTCTNGNRGFCVPTKTACRKLGGSQKGRCLGGSGRCCEVSCAGDDECPPNLACIDTICNKPSCTEDSECQSNLVCEEGECIDPCDNPDNPPCGTNAICSVDDNKVQCRCPPDFEGDANQACTECESDSECSADLACIDFACTDPCERPPCGLNAVCTVVEPHGLRCDCPEDFIGIPSQACFPARCNPDFDGSDGDCLTSAECANKGGVSEGTCFAGFGVCCSDCERNEDCPPNLACIGSTCQDPCPEICGDQDCTVEDHIAECKEIVPECKFDDECPSKLECRCREAADFDCIDLPCDCDENCPDNLSCTDSFCSDPCEIPGTCGYQATCTVVNHQPICDCPPYFTGNPSEVCFPAKCGSTSGPLGDCLTREDCRKQGGILYGTCASGFGVCCLDSRYCDHSDYASSLVCINSRPYSNIQSERKAVSYRKKKAVKGRRRITKRK